ncbi:hypothetical protein ACFE04_011980 [Oxalis oulophora]
MKLSLKLEDDNNPTLKAKLPLTIFNKPFTSSLTTTTPTPTTTTPKDVSFSLSTCFPSGPSLKLIYTPSSSSSSSSTNTPFCLSLKSGLGLFGSPNNSPLTFKANFSLSNNNNPSFSLHFKPKFGDFSLHRSVNSGSGSVIGEKLESGSASNGDLGNGFGSDSKIDTSCWQEVKLETLSGAQNPYNNIDDDSSNGFGFVPQNPLLMRSSASGSKKGGVFPGVGVKARTVLPLTKRVSVNLRWGLNYNPNAVAMKMPYLTLHKIGIERIEEVKVEDKKSDGNSAGDVELLKGMCFWMKSDLEMMAKENREMVQCLEDMKSKVAAKKNSYGKSDSIGATVSPILSDSSSNEFERWRKKNGGEGNGQKELKKIAIERNGQTQRELKKPPGKPVSNVEAELQRAIQAASS